MQCTYVYVHHKHTSTHRQHNQIARHANHAHPTIASVALIANIKETAAGDEEADFLVVVQMSATTKRGERARERARTLTYGRACAF